MAILAHPFDMMLFGTTQKTESALTRKLPLLHDNLPLLNAIQRCQVI